MNLDNYFIDIERFIKWTYKNPQLFYKDKMLPESPWTYSTAKNWRRLEKLSTDTINKINQNFLNGEEEFKIINIADFLMCVNMAKDHNRGNTSPKSKPVSSTGKKVLMILLLGRLIENDFKKSKLVIENDLSDPLYIYISSEENGFSGDIQKIYYYPGRTVSAVQLDKLVERYINKITRAGIRQGLKELVTRGFVKCVDKDNELYKLDFDGCYNFMIHNRNI